MTTTDVTLNAVDLSDAVPEAAILRVRRKLVGARRDTFVDVPGRAGAWVFREEPGDRTIVLELDLAGVSFATRRAAVLDLAEWADTPAGPVRLIIDDEPDRYYTVVLADDPDVDEWLNNAAAELTYRADPYAHAITTSSAPITATSGTAAGTFAASDTIVTYPVIEVTPLDGTLTGFTIGLNGDAITWTDETVMSGETVTISSISSTVTLGVSTDVHLTGAYNASDVAMATVSGTFPLIIPGTDINTYSITTTGTATNVRFVITWRRRYR